MAENIRREMERVQAEEAARAKMAEQKAAEENAAQEEQEGGEAAGEDAGYVYNTLLNKECSGCSGQCPFTWRSCCFQHGWTGWPKMYQLRIRIVL